MNVRRAVARVTDPVMPEGSERARIVEQDARLMAVLLYEPTPGYVAPLTAVRKTFEIDGQEDVCDRHGQVKYVLPDGRARCQECSNESTRRWRERRACGCGVAASGTGRW